MRDGLIGAIVGIVIALAVGYVIWGRPLGDAENRISAADARVQQAEAMSRSALAAYAARKPREAHITLRQKGNTADCDASIDHLHMGGYREEEVTWHIQHDEEKPCTEDKAWAVWLDFTDADHPFEDRKVRIGQTQRPIAIKKLATEKVPFTYKVVMVENSGNQYPLIDPDLEVEPPQTLNPPAAPPANPPATPPASPPANPPAKKQ